MSASESASAVLVADDKSKQDLVATAQWASAVWYNNSYHQSHQQLPLSVVNGFHTDSNPASYDTSNCDLDVDATFHRL